MGAAAGLSLLIGLTAPQAVPDRPTPFLGYGMAKTLHEDFPIFDVEDKMAQRYLNR